MLRRIALLVGPRQALVGLAAGLLFLCAPGTSRAAQRVALLQTDPQRSGDIAALVEASLAAAGKVTLIERQQVEKILREQQLQALLGAEATGGRTKFGMLLQADLLVFIQPQEKPQKYWDVVIAETHQGLRLIHQPVAAKDPAADAAAIQDLIAAALDKQSQAIQAIFAVPPFVSNDLGFEFGHFKGAYAKIIEGALARQNGVVVVELAEARAVAREITVTSGADVNRPLPLYVLGEYRTAVSASDRTVKLTLKLMQGDKQLAGGTKENLTLEQAPGFLEQVAQFFLSKSAAGPQAAADPKVEAAQLAERARLLLSVGSWPESLDLIEASLLLDPHQPLLDRDAVVVLTEFAGNRIVRNGSPLDAPADPKARLAYYRLGLEHVERYLRAEFHDSNLNGLILGKFAYSLNEMGTRLHKDQRGDYAHAPDWPLYVESRDAARDMIYRVLADKVRRKVVDDTTAVLRYYDDCLVDDMEWGIRNVDNEPRALARRDRRLKLLADFTYLPDEGQLLWRMLDDTCPHHYNSDVPPSEKGDELSFRPDYLDFLKQVRELSNEGLRKVADERLGNAAFMRQRGKDNVADRPVQPKQWNKPDTDIEVNFTRLTLHINGGGKVRTTDVVSGCLPVGKGVDFVWCPIGAYLMQEKGVLQPIRDQLGHPVRGGDFKCFDGKYVWTEAAKFIRAGVNQKTWQLIDPQLGKVVEEIEIGKLLPEYQTCQLAGLEPGRVAVVAYFGQTYIATVDFQPGAETRAKIIHEFHKVVKTGDLQQWRDPDLIFQPGATFTLSQTTAGGGTQQALLAWRRADSFECMGHPLIVDLPGGAVRAVETYMPSDFRPRKYAAGDGVVYMIEGFGHKPLLHRIGLAGVTDRPINEGLDNGIALFDHDGLLHCIDDAGRSVRPAGYPVADATWNVAAKDSGMFHTLKMNLPAGEFCVAAFRSAHYGLLASVVELKPGSWSQTTELVAHQVSFSKPLTTLFPAPALPKEAAPLKP